jgi:TolB-like protein
MKRCPECRRDYFDDTLLYCLDDGTALLEGPASGNEPATAILHETAPPGEAATRAQIHTTEQTAVLSSGAADHSNAKGFDKRLLLAPLVLGAIVVGGFLGYRYLSSSSDQISSIAVMPFVNASGNADIEYLSDGMTESLMNSLSQLPSLSVKARSSVFRYKGKEIEPVAVAQELGVQAVLNGRVVQRGEQLTLSLDLVDARTGNQIWGEQYNRKLGDLAALQTEIARDVSQKLRQRLTGAQETSVTKNQTQNTEAYQLYLQGRYHWNKRTSGNTKKAIEYFQQAIEKDPSYALAYVGLADSYIVSDMGLRERSPKIVAAAQKALEIDPSLGEAHAALATSKWSSDLDYTGAEREYRRAIELSPNYATAYHWLAESLVFQGRFDEGFAEFKKALDLEPMSLAISTDLGRGYYFARQYDRSIEHFKKLIEMDPNYVRTHFYLSEVYKEKGMCEEAMHEIEKGRELVGAKVDDEWKKGSRVIADACKTSGVKGAWQKTLELTNQDIQRGESVPAVEMAEIYARIGDRDGAFEWLEKVFDLGEAGGIKLKVEPAWDNLRDDPRFAELLKRAGY